MSTHTGSSRDAREGRLLCKGEEFEDEFFAKYEGMIWKLARRMLKMGASDTITELVNIGYIALYRAKEKFERKFANTVMEEKKRLVKFSTYAHMKIEAAMRLNGRPDIEDLTLSLDEPRDIGSDVPDEETCLYNILPANIVPADKQLLYRQIWELVEELPKRHALVLRKRFEDGMTLDEIGKELGVVRERVRQIEARSLTILRKRLQPSKEVSKAA